MSTNEPTPRVVRSLRVSSERMASACPVFIVGHPRSGTSLLFRTIQQHPAFRPRTVNLHETQIFTRISSAVRFDSHPPRQLLGFMLDDREHFAAFLDETRAIRRVAAPLAPISMVTRGDLPLSVWRAAKQHLVVRSYLAHAWSARSAERLVEKSPRNTHHLDKIRLVSPESRLLFMSRHPLDVLASYRRRANAHADTGAHRWTDISRPRFVRIYRDAARRALAAKDARGLLLVRYEDFTADPANEMRRICTHIGVPFVPEVLDERAGENLRKQPDALLQSAITQRSAAWEELVSVTEARDIEARLAGEMARLGHRPASR